MDEKAWKVVMEKKRDDERWKEVASGTVTREMFVVFLQVSLLFAFLSFGSKLGLSGILWKLVRAGD